MENKELKERFIDERTGIEYVRQGDYYIPNLVLPKQKKIHLNKYGRIRLNYLKEHKKAEYTMKLTREIGKGFSKSNLFNMRRFYLTYSKIPDASGILGWSHYCELIAIKDENKRNFYE